MRRMFLPKPAPNRLTTFHYNRFQYFSSDTCNLIHTTSTYDLNHILTFIDDASRHLSISFIEKGRKVTFTVPFLISALRACSYSQHKLRKANAINLCSLKDQNV